MKNVFGIVIVNIALIGCGEHASSSVESGLQEEHANAIGAPASTNALLIGSWTLESLDEDVGRDLHYAGVAQTLARLTFSADGTLSADVCQDEHYSGALEPGPGNGTAWCGGSYERKAGTYRFDGQHLYLTIDEFDMGTGSEEVSYPVVTTSSGISIGSFWGTLAWANFVRT